MKRLLLLTLATLLSCSTPKPPSPQTLAGAEALATGAGLAVCLLLPPQDRLAAIPVVTQLVAYSHTNVPALMTALEAAAPGQVGTGQIWQAIHNVFTVVSVAADYQPIAVSAVDGCASALGIPTT